MHLLDYYKKNAGAEPGQMVAHLHIRIGARSLPSVADLMVFLEEHHIDPATVQLPSIFAVEVVMDEETAPAP